MAAPKPDPQLPAGEFAYFAGPTDRPFEQFLNRWQAIKPRLAEIFQACGTERPLRLVDVGSCTGFFSLQAAFQHPEADVVGVEGSVGIGNGVVGMAGSVANVLQTPAVKTHLKWIGRLGLQNCMVAPEVWDYNRICDLVSMGRPICDVSLMLSVIHHIDNVSHDQYAAAGLSKADGTADLISKLLSLAPNHFVELPYKPWMTDAYEAFGTQRGILEAATKRSQHAWNFVGPIHNCDWFGPRELWLIQAKPGSMLPMDLTVNPFHQLVSDVDGDGDEMSSEFPAADAPVLGPPARGPVGNRPVMSAHGYGLSGANADFDSGGLGPLGGLFANDSLGNIGSCQHVGGHLQIDPAVTALCSEPRPPVEDRIAVMLQKSPTSLLVAHLVLREAQNEAEVLLQQVREANARKEPDSAKNSVVAQNGVQRHPGPTAAGIRAPVTAGARAAATNQIPLTPAALAKHDIIQQTEA